MANPAPRVLLDALLRRSLTPSLTFEPQSWATLFTSLHQLGNDKVIPTSLSGSDVLKMFITDPEVGRGLRRNIENFNADALDAVLGVCSDHRMTLEGDLFRSCVNAMTRNAEAGKMNARKIAHAMRFLWFLRPKVAEEEVSEYTALVVPLIEALASALLVLTNPDDPATATQPQPSIFDWATVARVIAMSTQISDRLTVAPSKDVKDPKATLLLRALSHISQRPAAMRPVLAIDVLFGITTRTNIAAFVATGDGTLEDINNPHSRHNHYRHYAVQSLLKILYHVVDSVNTKPTLLDRTSNTHAVRLLLSASSLRLTSLPLAQFFGSVLRHVANSGEEKLSALSLPDIRAALIAAVVCHLVPAENASAEVLFQLYLKKMTKADWSQRRDIKLVAMLVPALYPTSIPDWVQAGIEDVMIWLLQHQSEAAVTSTTTTSKRTAGEELDHYYDDVRLPQHMHNFMTYLRVTAPDMVTHAEAVTGVIMNITPEEAATAAATTTTVPDVLTPNSAQNITTLSTAVRLFRAQVRKKREDVSPQDRQALLNALQSSDAALAAVASWTQMAIFCDLVLQMCRACDDVAKARGQDRGKSVWIDHDVFEAVNHLRGAVCTRVMQLVFELCDEFNTNHGLSTWRDARLLIRFAAADAHRPEDSQVMGMMRSTMLSDVLLPFIEARTSIKSNSNSPEADARTFVDIIAGLGRCATHFDNDGAKQPIFDCVLRVLRFVFQHRAKLVKQMEPRDVVVILYSLFNDNCSSSSSRDVDVGDLLVPVWQHVLNALHDQMTRTQINIVLSLCLRRPEALPGAELRSELISKLCSAWVAGKQEHRHQHVDVMRDTLAFLAVLVKLKDKNVLSKEVIVHGVLVAQLSSSCFSNAPLNNVCSLLHYMCGLEVLASHDNKNNNDIVVVDEELSKCVIRPAMERFACLVEGGFRSGSVDEYIEVVDIFFNRLPAIYRSLFPFEDAYLDVILPLIEKNIKMFDLQRQSTVTIAKLLYVATSTFKAEHSRQQNFAPLERLFVEFIVRLNNEKDSPAATRLRMSTLYQVVAAVSRVLLVSNHRLISRPRSLTPVLGSLVLAVNLAAHTIAHHPPPSSADVMNKMSDARDDILRCLVDPNRIVLSMLKNSGGGVGGVLENDEFIAAVTMLKNGKTWDGTGDHGVALPESVVNVDVVEAILRPVGQK
eukprot:PhM_4_TR10851/c0_g3_i1/m.86394